MSDNHRNKALFAKKEKWTKENDVDPLHEGIRPAINPENLANTSADELQRQMAELIAELPRETVLIEDVFAEAKLVGDPEGEPYSRSKTMASIWDTLADANNAICDIPEQYHGAVQHAMDCAFTAGQSYHYIRFREKFAPDFERNKARPHNGGAATQNSLEKKNRPILDPLFNRIDDLMSADPIQYKRPYPAAVAATAEGYGAQTGDGVKDIQNNYRNYLRESADRREKRKQRREQL